MEHLTLPNNIQMPKLGFGTFQLQDAECENVIGNAIDAGYRHIDTAQMYENEEHIGRAINKAIKAGKVTRDELFITTKIHPFNLEPATVLSSVEESLRKLGTQHIDLLLIHFDPLHGGGHQNLEETLGAMYQLMKDGKVKAIGLSNFNSERMKEVAGIADRLGFKIACNQIEYHPFLVQPGLLKCARDNKIAITAYSPLFGGQSYVSHSNSTVQGVFADGGLIGNPTLKTIAAKYRKTPQQVALRWLMDQDGVAAIPGTGNKEHAASNFNIFDFTLTEEEHRNIEQLNKNARIFHAGPNYWESELSHSPASSLLYAAPSSRTEETVRLIEGVATRSEGHGRAGLWAAGIAAAAALVGGGWALYEQNRKKERSSRQNSAPPR